MFVTVHVAEAESPYPTGPQVVRAEPPGYSPTLAAADLGSHAASGAGADVGAGNNACPTAGKSRAVEGNGRRIGTAVGAHLAELCPGSLGRSSLGVTARSRIQLGRRHAADWT
jgi:hypothetical protein